MPPLHDPPQHDSLVWYVSYGSNMNAQRLDCYLRGGRPEGALITYTGARDGTPPRASAGVMLPGRLRFASRSAVWGGSMAFYDHHSPGPTAARAYLLTAQQFVDVAAQEMHREPSTDDLLEEVVRSGVPGGSFTAGPGHYETLLNVGEREGRPMLTFTAPAGARELEPGLPVPAYLSMLTEGLAQGHGWDPAACTDYFARCGAFTADAAPAPAV
ncbi:histone deacetylase [Brachybacterium hainanense]|uniref:Histone deacetylase n=1 Tax=Brachybacterium hainanense TaxID=1541174 RepID=A0ABV6R615_9MICO